MNCKKCKKEMRSIQKDGRTYFVCQNCREIHSADAPEQPSHNKTDTLLHVCLGFLVFSILALLSGFILWGITESGSTQQLQDTQTAAASTKTLTRSDLIKQGKIKVKKSAEEPADSTLDKKADSSAQTPPITTIPAQTSPTTVPTVTAPANTETPQTDNATQNSQSEPMVWLTETGRKYHNRNDCGFTNPDKAYQVTISYAEAHSDGPCKICFY